MNHLNGDNEFQTNEGSLLQLAPTTGLVVTGNGASCNTCNIPQSVVLGNIQLMGVEIQSKRIPTLILSLAQELRATFDRMTNKVVVTLGQVVTIFRGKL